MNAGKPAADMQGILCVNKPANCTSRDIVSHVQRFLGRKTKVGHAGTLDPMATGVLLVCVGRATRLIPVIHEFSKSYEAGFTLGQSSNTDDSTGEVTVLPVAHPPDRHTVQSHLQKQIGTIQQTPPAFSAVKVAGQRAYKAARAGEKVLIKPRPVQVLSIELLHYEFPELIVDICCGSGTYIRSIARDLGASLGTGGLMHHLVRTRIGPFEMEDGATIQELIESAAAGQVIQSRLQPVESLFHQWDQHVLSASEIESLRDGRPLELDSPADRLAALTDKGRFAAVLERTSKGPFRATINWVPAWFQ